MKKNLWIWAVVGAMALPTTGLSQFGPKPGQPQPPVVVKPGQPQPAKPQSAPAVKPAPKPQPAPVVKPAPQQPPKPQPPVVVKPAPPQQPPKPQPPKPQPPVVVKPAPPQPPVVAKPAPPVEYRPGHKNHPLQPPKAREHYKDWMALHHKRFYKLVEAPERMQVSMRVGQEVEFKLEERTGDGLRWFARYDSSMLDVDIEHEGRRWYRFGSTAHSEVEIEAHRPGNTMVELVYARPGEWDRGDAPQKVLQIFVHVE